MAALTADRNTLERFPQVRSFVTAATIHAGSMVAINATGKAVPASVTANLTVVGRAEFPAATGENVNVKTGCFAYAATGITVADIGKTVYVVDDQTVTKTAATGENAVNIVAGTVFDVDTEGVWVKIN